MSGVETSAYIIRRLDDEGLPRTPKGVRQLFDPVRTPIGTYPFPELRQPGRLRVVSLVSNSVDGDSRVQKVAASLADLGYESILLGRHPDKDGRDHYFVGRALVVRLPVALASHEYEREAPPRTPTAALAFRSQREARSARRHARAESRRLSAAQAAGTATGRDVVEDHWRRWLTAVRHTLHEKNRARFFSLRGDATIETAGPWRRPLTGDLDHWARADDYELGYGPFLEWLRPDIIHAHDSDMIGVAMTAADRLRQGGDEVRVIYDAHEYTPGTARSHARQSVVLSAVEHRLVPRADAVVTVSEEIADLLVAEHRLTRRPEVVRNAPTEAGRRGRAGVRQRLGLPDTTPLLVYVGGVAPQRGVDLAVAALAQLPYAHLVVVAPDNPRTTELAAQATSLNVRDRFHRVDYVAHADVVDFISSCDVGLIPFRPLPNSELGIPTKFREYLVAGLPIVASDQGLVAEEIRRLGVGELFPTGDVDGLARAVAKVLADAETYREAVTPELLAASVWERQVATLERVYARVAGADAPNVRRSDVARTGVLIGRTNTAGQAGAWARSLRQSGVPATSLHVVDDAGPFDFDADITVHGSDWTRPNYRLRAFVDLVPRFGHALIESGIPLLDDSSEPLGDLDALVRSGLSVGLLFHGSDVRRPLRHAEREPWSPFRDPTNEPLVAHLHERTGRMHSALARYDGPTFISTPDLWDDLPWATWVPVVIDQDVFVPDGRDLSERSRPVVVHLPSHGALQGTRMIDPTLRRLHAEGVIRYWPIRDVPHAAMPAVLSAADIVVDQVLMNRLGVGAAEAMACGRTVVGRVDERLAERFPSRPPVVDATPETLEHVLRSLAVEPARLADLGRKGREFALAVHDGRLSVRAIASGLGLSGPF